MVRELIFRTLEVLETLVSLNLQIMTIPAALSGCALPSRLRMP